MSLYTIKARLWPALLTVLPIGLASVAWFPEQLLSWRGFAGLVTSCGLSMLMSELARDRGKGLEPELFRMWGGKPTTQLLRHADNGIDPNTKVRYRARLRVLVPGCHMPTQADEQADPRAADDAYASFVKFLLERTRDRKRFPLILKELRSYGFRRNLWGLKPYGLAIGTPALGVCVVSLLPSGGGHHEEPIAWGASMVCLFLLLCWLFRIKPAWVRLTAFAYARQLLAACETLKPEGSSE